YPRISQLEKVGALRWGEEPWDNHLGTGQVHRRETDARLPRVFRARDGCRGDRPHFGPGDGRRAEVGVPEIIDGFRNPWSPPSRLWGWASEGKRKGREGFVLRSQRLNRRWRIKSLLQHHFVVRIPWVLPQSHPQTSAYDPLLGFQR